MALLNLFAVQREELRSRLGEATAARFSNSELTRWLNLSAQEFQDRARVITRNKSYSTVANQQRYTLPDDWSETIASWYQPGTLVRPLVKRKLEEMLTWMFQTGDPYCHAVNEDQREDWLYPVPSASAGADQLNGAVSATATTLTLDSTSDFPSRGRVTIDDECIYYTGKTSTTLTGCVRASEDTKAESHSDNAVVTWRDVEFSYYAVPRFRHLVYTTGTITTLNYESASVTGSSTAWTSSPIAAGMFLGVGSMGSIGTASTTFPLQWYEIESVDSATGITLTQEYNQASVSSGAAYIITEKTDIPERFCPAVIEIAMLFSEMKDDNLKDVPVWNARVNEIVKRAMGASGMPADYLPYSREHTMVTPGLPQYPSNYPLRGY